MKILKPQYYDHFHCLAAACPDSCCKEWAVQVDDTSVQYYRSLPGALGDALRAALTEEDGDTILSLTEDMRCPMWRRDGLCRIQAELGESALCDTCRNFPRLTHDYGDFMELGLELSCPEAARLILADDSAWLCENRSGGSPGDYDREAMDILLSSRDTALRFIRSTSLPLNHALCVLLLYGYEVQNHLDGGNPALLAPEDDLQQARKMVTGGNLQGFLDFFKGLEILTSSWLDRLNNPLDSSWTNEYRALAIYFIQRYWLQAISDYDLVGRVKLSICSCLLIKLLGGNIQETAQLYSKEIENNTANVFSILDGAYEDTTLTDRNLLALLLEG